MIVLAAAALMSLPLSCIRPASYEEFVRADEAVGGIYSFTLDLADSLCAYDISFYIADTLSFHRGTPGGRYGGRPPIKSRQQAERQPEMDGIPIYAVWSSDTLCFEELVYLDTHKVVQPYRTGVQMVHPGEWKLDLRPMEVPAAFRGIGVICRRKEL